MVACGLSEPAFLKNNRNGTPTTYAEFTKYSYQATC